MTARTVPNLNDLPEFLISSAGLSDECAPKWGLKLSLYMGANVFSGR